MRNIRKFHPGIYIKDSLEVLEMTAKEFSLRTGISERTLSSIINGNGDITFDIAYKLSLYFDNEPSTWMNLQTEYNTYLLETIEEQRIKEEWNLIKTIKKYLNEHNYILESDTYDVIVKKCRKLVGVNSLLLLQNEDSFVNLKEQHTQKESDYFFQNFYISLALKEARNKNHLPFNKKLLLESLDEIRKMTNEEPNIFYPKLEDVFSKCGVSFVFIPYIPKSNIYGATKWFSKDNVMLAISNRNERADLFWFTLFHEISHVLMEHKRVMLINMNGIEDKEADEMAANLLINAKEWNDFVSKKDFTLESIKTFASIINIHPSIVLGRLQKEKRVPYDRFTKELSVKYSIN